MDARDEALAERGEVIDRYMALKHPERYKRMQDGAQQATERFFSGVDREQAIKQADQAKREGYASFIPDGAPYTVDDVLAGKQYKRNLNDSGKHRTEHHYRNLDIALSAFIRVEQQGGETRDAIAEALEDLTNEKHGSSEKTIRQWLAAILPFSTLKQTSRGRPKK